MPIYEITSWSRVLGDNAYVEAQTPALAMTALMDQLGRDGVDDVRTVNLWHIIQMNRPVCIIAWKSRFDMRTASHSSRTA
jgi:hypothetical protein